MKTPRFDRTTWTVLVVCLVLLLLSGCSSWRVKPYPAYLQDSEGHLEHVRITLNNGDEITIVDAHVEGDSIVGLSDSIERTRVAVALADIGALEVREADTGKTIAAILIPVAAVGLAIGMAVVWMYGI